MEKLCQENSDVQYVAIRQQCLKTVNGVVNHSRQTSALLILTGADGDWLHEAKPRTGRDASLSSDQLIKNARRKLAVRCTADRSADVGTRTVPAPPPPLLSCVDSFSDRLKSADGIVSLAVLSFFHFLRTVFCSAMLCKRGLCRHAVSVCLSMSLSRSWIMSKRIKISSKVFFTVG